MKVEIIYLEFIIEAFILGIRQLYYETGKDIYMDKLIQLYQIEGRLEYIKSQNKLSI